MDINAGDLIKKLDGIQPNDPKREEKFSGVIEQVLDSKTNIVGDRARLKNRLPEVYENLRLEEINPGLEGDVISAALVLE